MSWLNQIADVLQNYSKDSGQPDQREVENDFGRVAGAAPRDDLAGGIAEVFRSDQTPPFPQLVSRLFGNSDPNQRANLLNTLLASGAGAAVVSQIAKAAGISLPTTGGTQITPDQAAQIPPQAVEQAAEQVEKRDPSIVDQLSRFYAQHPTLVQTLGTVAMSMAMSHLARRRR